MRKAQDIVTEIEVLGARLSSLKTNQTSNLNLNLGLSNLGLVHQDPKFQFSFSSLLKELQEVYEEYKERPALTHWDLQAPLSAITDATTLVHEILDQLAENQYSVLDSSIYLSRFAAVSEPFKNLGSYNMRDPMYISITRGGSYSYALHAERTESELSSSNGIVRINQFMRLLGEIQRSFELIKEKLDGDAQEILNDLEIANEIPRVSRGGLNGFLQQSVYNPKPWSEKRLPLDELMSRIKKELLCIHRLYLGLNAGNASWDDILWHFEGIFDLDIVRGMTQYFSEEDEIIVTTEGDEPPILDYQGLSVGLDEIRKLDQAYDSWYSEFQDRKKRMY